MVNSLILRDYHSLLGLGLEDCKVFELAGLVIPTELEGCRTIGHVSSSCALAARMICCHGLAALLENAIGN